MHFDLQQLIQTVGLLGVFAIVFTESGLLVGFFFPGDSLLFTAGFLASQGFLNIYILTIGCFIAAVLGDSTGYYIGHKFGPKLFNKPDSLFFHKDHLLKAQNFYERHGGKTIVLARFMPIIRTFAPVVAGIGTMRYPAFLFYNIFGAFLWAVCVTLLGFYFGKIIPAEAADKYIILITGLIILASIAPGLYHALKDKHSRSKCYLLACATIDKVLKRK